MSEYEITVSSGGIVVAQTFIEANGKEDFTLGLMAACRDAENGDDEWLDDITEDDDNDR